MNCCIFKLVESVAALNMYASKCPHKQSTLDLAPISLSSPLFPAFSTIQQHIHNLHKLKRWLLPSLLAFAAQKCNQLDHNLPSLLHSLQFMPFPMQTNSSTTFQHCTLLEIPHGWSPRDLSYTHSGVIFIACRKQPEERHLHSSLIVSLQVTKQL